MLNEVFKKKFVINFNKEIIKYHYLRLKNYAFRKKLKLLKLVIIIPIKILKEKM